MENNSKFIEHENKVTQKIEDAIKKEGFSIAREVSLSGKNNYRFDGIIYDGSGDPYSIIDIKYRFNISIIKTLLQRLYFNLKQTNIRFGILTDGKLYYFIDSSKTNQKEIPYEAIQFEEVIKKLLNKVEITTPQNEGVLKIVKQYLLKKEFPFYDTINNLSEKDIVFNRGFYSFSNEIENKIFASLIPNLIPKEVCRYTSLNTLFYMIKNNSIRMNGIVGMNDRSEVGFLENYFYEDSKERTKTVQEINQINNTFILSCSPTNTMLDNLTMWRLYADEGRGCCLIFDVVKPLTSGFIINPIKYLDLDNEELIPKEIQALKEIIYNKEPPFEFKTLTTWSHFFKPKEYEIENEVRVLYQCNENKKKDWLITNDYSIINPFLEFDLFNNYVLHLKEIILGFNCPQLETNKMQLQALLEYKGLNNIKIINSNIKSFR